MSAATAYLEAAKTEEVASRLKAQGYSVAANTEAGFDLVATRGNEVIAVEVKAATDLAASSAQLRQLRNYAKEHGFTNFRLVVANPPREVEVQVEGLNATLLDYLRDNLARHLTLPEDLTEYSAYMKPVDVGSVEINSISVGPDMVRIVGSGAVEIAEDSRKAAQEDPRIVPVFGGYDLPLLFDIVLDRNNKLKKVHTLNVNGYEPGSLL